MAKTSGEVPPHILVFVPGYMGSKLRDRNTKEVVWIDFSGVPLLPWKWGPWLERLFEMMAYPNEDLEPAGVMDQVIFVPPWAKQEHYNRLYEALRGMGYKLDERQFFGGDGDPGGADESKLNCYAFPYDWRQDNRESARRLARAVERWRSYHPGAEVWIIAHSNGGLVARWYTEKEGGKEFVTRLFLMGSPWDGTPKAMHLAFGGFDTLFRRSFNLFGIAERTRRLVRTFPSIYQLIPFQNPFLVNLDNERVDPFGHGTWLDDEGQRGYLEEGRRFNEELGSSLTPHTVCFFGRRQMTPTSGRVRLAANNAWEHIEWTDSEEGDGTIPARSADNPEAEERIPYPVNHGNIYVDEDVLEKLKFELIDRHRRGAGEVRAVAVSQNLTVVFEPDRDTYSPGESVGMWATLHTNDSPPQPVTNASITVQPAWYEPLPGSSSGRPAADPAGARLKAVAGEAGRYEGDFTAPDAEGYYHLRATVRVKGKLPVRLEELIAIEPPVDITPPAGDGVTTPGA
ncbi:MAG TPA: hypothetical protein VJ866_13000 [Pyrinomonadaceae bacterium]|nr:hypothetical protein [Pyrinomonadaceae bacterium]